MANGLSAPCPRTARTLPPLPTEAYEEGRTGRARLMTSTALKANGRKWWASSGKPKLDNPAAAFVGFCRSRHKRAPIRRDGDRTERNPRGRPLPDHETENPTNRPWMAFMESPPPDGFFFSTAIPCPDFVV